MELIYFYIHRSANHFIEKNGFNFSSKYKFSVTHDDKKCYLTGNKNENSLPERFFDNTECVTNVTAIVGENGSGKTTLLNEILSYSTVSSQMTEILSIYLEGTKLICCHNIGGFENHTDLLQEENIHCLKDGPDEFISRIYISNSTYVDAVDHYDIENSEQVVLNPDEIRRLKNKFFKKGIGHIVGGYYELRDVAILESIKISQFQHILDVLYLEHLYSENIDSTFAEEIGKNLNISFYRIGEYLNDFYGTSQKEENQFQQYHMQMQEVLKKIEYESSEENIFTDLYINLLYELLVYLVCSKKSKDIFEKLISNKEETAKKDLKTLIDKLLREANKDTFKDAFDEIKKYEECLKESQIPNNFSYHNRYIHIKYGNRAYMLSSLYSLISTTEDYHKYVNDTVRLSLYGDFLYPLAEDSTLEKFYDEKPEGEFCAELHAARAEVWKVLRPYRMKLLRLAPAKFIHFGTTREILALMSGGVDAYKALGWSKKVNSSISGNTAGYNSVLSERAEIGDDCYLEVSFVHSKASVGKNVVLSYIDIHDEQIPDDVVLHGLKQKDGKFVCRIYGVEDNPKENRLFGMNLEEALEKAGIQPSEVWDQEEHLLWFAKIYPECGNIRDAVDAALNLYDLLHGKGDLEAWKKMQKKSLCSGFNDADSSAIIAWNKRMQELVRMDEIAKDIRYGKPVKETAALEPLTQLQENWLERRLKRADFSETVRLNYYIGTALGSRHGDRYVAESFKTISGQILEATLQNLQYNDSCKIVTEKHTVNLPLRVNWGGGWSDTPPICCEMGGTVLNAAISLNRELPVEVTLIKIPEKKIVFDSRDMDVHGEFDSIEELQKTGDPYDPFALQKACLLACGIIPSEGGSLDEILTRLGGGFEMHSEVTNVPKGSGLGTSSILSAACVKAVFEFMGISYTEEELYAHVLVMEQIMSTGGGWQDQVGGVTNGIKYITSKPGLDQQLRVEHIELQPETKKELNERFCLIYTGQRRLARNLLRDVVGRYVGNEPDSLYALNEIQKVAALMRFELERGKIDEFADLLNYHWELSRKVDAGSTNTLIDQIFLSIEDLIDAKMVCGAGGGGFLQVILKKGVQKADVHKRLKDVFQDNPVDVWDCEII